VEDGNFQDGMSYLEGLCVSLETFEPSSSLVSSTKTTFGKKTMRKVEENPTFFGVVV